MKNPALLKMSRDAHIHTIKQVLNTVALFCFGVGIVIPGFVLYVLVTVPFYIYRLFVSKILRNTFLCPNGIASIVSLGFGINHAADFISCTALPSKPSRNTIASRHFVKGRIPEQEVRQMIMERWLESKSPNGEYKYPEGQQYIVSWMGYMFWKNDSRFDLNNHFETHYCTNSKLDQYTEDLKEELLNKPYKSNRSPWEIHAVYSCNCEIIDSQVSDGKCIICGQKEMTVFVFRGHHCLGDGFSLLFVALEGLFDCRLIDSLTKQKSDDKNQSGLMLFNNHMKNSVLCNAAIGLRLLFQICIDMGFVVYFVLFRICHPTSLRISNSLKHSTTAKSVQIPLQRIKQIKSHYGVSFSSVLLSCVSAALAKHISKSKEKQDNGSMLIVFPVPLPNHPFRKLANHVTFVPYNVPTHQDLDCKQRLLACNNVMQQVNRSLVTQVIFPWVLNLMSCYIRPIAQFGLYNRTFITAVSNIPLPSAEEVLVNNKYPIANMDYALGLGDGVPGTIFYTLAYKNVFQFMATADEAVLSGKEIQTVINNIVQELDCLYQCTLCV